MKIIGLTGGIASGKSTVGRMLAARGAHVIDADKLGHAAYEPGTPAFGRVVAAFGADIVGADGRIDRRVLGGKVFGQPSELARLTGIVWPAIRQMAADEIARVRAEDRVPAAVLEAAVMLEAQWDDAMDEVWVVTVEPAVAIARAVARDGLDPAAVQQRIDAQMSNAARRARATAVIDNSTDLADLERQVDALWAGVLAGAAP